MSYPRVDFLYLSEPDMIKAGVRDVLGCTDCMEEVVKLLYKGDYRMGGESGNSHGCMVQFPKNPEFPNMPKDGPDRRFMAMPAYLGGSFDMAGCKWYGSNVENRTKKLPRSCLMLTLNGALGALVAVCTGVAEVSYLGAVIIGIVSGIMLPLSVEFVDKALHVDDPAGAISLHGTNGILGVIEGGLLSTTQGLLYGHGARYLLVQLLGVVSIGAFILGTTFLMFFFLKKTMGIRVTREEELDGLDKHEHAMLAYVM